MKSRLVCWPIDLATRPISIWLAGQYCVLYLDFVLVRGIFGFYAFAMMVNAWSYNFDSGTSTAFLYDSTVEAGQKDRYLQISSFLSGVAEVTRTLGTVVAGFFIHGALAWTYLIAIGLSFLSIILIYLMKEPMAKREINEILTF